MLHQRVVDDEQTGLLNGVRAKGDAAMGFADADADLRLEPLSILVDERNKGDRHLEDLRGEQRQIVERSLGLGVEDAIPVQALETRRFFGGHTGGSVTIRLIRRKTRSEGAMLALALK